MMWFRVNITLHQVNSYYDTAENDFMARCPTLFIHQGDFLMEPVIWGTSVFCSPYSFGSTCRLMSGFYMN